MSLRQKVQWSLVNLEHPATPVGPVSPVNPHLPGVLVSQWHPAAPGCRLNPVLLADHYCLGDPERQWRPAVRYRLAVQCCPADP